MKHRIISHVATASRKAPSNKQGGDVYGYSDNDVKVQALRDAATLDAMVGG